MRVDWQERSVAAEAIDQAFAAIAVGASEAELRAVAKKAIQPAILKGEQRIEAEAVARKKAEAKQHKGEELFAARVFYTPERLCALASRGILDQEEVSDHRWIDEVTEAVSSLLQKDLTGEENSEQVKELARQLVARS